MWQETQDTGIAIQTDPIEDEEEFPQEERDN